MKGRIVLSGILLILMLGGCASSKQMSAEEVENARKSKAAAREAFVREQFRTLPHDSSVKWQISAVALKYNHIMDIRLVAPNRLFLAFASGWARSPVMVNTDNGSIVWTKEILQCEDRIVAKDRTCDVTVASLAVYRDLIIVRADCSGGSMLFAMETATGNVRWQVELIKSGELLVVPILTADMILAVQQDKRQSTITAFNLSTGTVVWKTESAYGNGTDEPPVPIVRDDAIWTFYDGVAKLSPMNGKTEWHRGDIIAGKQSPPMQVEDRRLYVLDGKNTLHVLDAHAGKSLGGGKQRAGAKYTNIFPISDRVYLRGLEKGASGEPMFFVAAVRPADGKELWADSNKVPSVSNLIDQDRTLYFSTSYTLIAVDRETGARRFAVKASDIGKSYPVQIKKYGDRIVYIGELVIAAFNAQTGEKIYRRGFDPINQTAHMDALEWAIERNTKILAMFSSPVSGLDLKSAGMSNFFFEQSRYSQNQSNYAAQQASKYARSYEMSGDQLAASRSTIKMQESLIASSFAQAQFSMGMAFTTMENIQKGVAQAIGPVQAELERLMNIRKLLFAAYAASLRGDYVHRPTKEGDVVGVSIIHLPSGNSRYTELTPEYDELGIFSLVDFEKAIIYHQGVHVGDDSKGYFFAKPVLIPK